MPLPSVPASESLPLDAVASSLVAFGFRKLRRDYAGNCIGLTRSSDNGVSNVGFDAAGDIDVAAIASHVGANNGTIATWFDQSGNGTNATNATVSGQPTLVTSGAIKRNHGKPVAEFRGDTLSITLGSEVANDALTIIAVMQSRAASVTDIVTFVTQKKAGDNILIYDITNQRLRITSHVAAGGSWSQTDDPTDWTYPIVRPQILVCILDSGDCSFWHNGAFAETFSLANHGETGSTIVFGGTAGTSNLDVSEVIIYDRVLSNAEIERVHRSINEYHRLASDDRVPELLIRQRWPADSVIQRWVRSLTATDLTVTRGNLSWDDTYADTDDLMRMYLVFHGGYANYQEHLRALVANPVWFLVNPDPNGDGGLESSTLLKQFETNDHGTEAGTLAVFYANSLPKSGSAEGNPYYQQRAVGLRAIVSAAYSLMAFMQEAEHDVNSHVTDFIGGNLMASAFAFRLCRDVLPKNIDNAFQDMLYVVCQKLWWLKAHDINGNIDVKAVAGLAQCSACFDREDWRTACAEAARNILFGSRTGTAATTNKATGIYSAAGYVDEGDSPDTTYNGHSLNWMQEAYRVTYGDPLWSFLQDVVEDMVAFKTYQYFPDPDGYVDGPSGYAGRTGGSYVFDQGTEAWRQHNSAAITAVGRHLGDTLGNEAALVSDINTAISQWNGSANIDDDCIQVSGTAAAHTNGSSSTTVTLTNTPTLTGLITANDSETDWRSYLWLDINGGTWSRITAFNNTAKTVTCVHSFNIASGSPVNYRIEKGPKIWGSAGTWWPPENYYPVPDGYYAAQRALIVAADSSLQTPWESAADHNVNFADEFWSFKENDGTRDWGFFVEAIENPGLYDGWYGGTLQQFWTRDTGTVICARHDKAGPTAAQFENTRFEGGASAAETYDRIDKWATTHIWGIDSGDKAFSSAAIHGGRTGESSTYDINGTPKSVSTSRILEPSVGVGAGFEAGTSITGDLTVTNTFEVVGTSGLRHLAEIANSGSDTVKELWATIPIYLRDTDQSMSDTTIEYWNGSAWATLSTTLVSTDAIRLMRNFGAGAKYAYIEFASSQSVKLNAAVWVQTYQGDSRHRNIKIDLLGYTGSAQAFPATASVDYSVVTTNPHS